MMRGLKRVLCVRSIRRMAAAAADLTEIGSSVSAANSVAAGPTTNVLAAAGDEVSAAIAAIFPAMPVNIRR